MCRVFGCSKEKGQLTESTCQADRGEQIAFLSCICKDFSKGWHFAPLSLGLSLLWAMSPSGCECKCKHFNRLVHRHKSLDAEPRPLPGSTWSLDVCIGYLFLCCEEIPDRKHLKRGFVHLQSSQMVTGIYCWEAGRDKSWRSAPSLLFMDFRAPSPWMLLPAFSLHLPASVKRF